MAATVHVNAAQYRLYIDSRAHYQMYALPFTTYSNDSNTKSNYFSTQPHFLVLLLPMRCFLRGTSWSLIIITHFKSSGYCIYRYLPPGLTFINPTFCPHSVFMCFVWIWEQTAIISIYSINWLVCINETECVYCAVRTGSLYIILRSAHTAYLCVLCGSENKQLLFPYTALTGWFV
jgi:hypothetical protein